ncbi:hypothetical protein K9K77_00055 [Candidatus Babeliales bacterium]|nr:hypothetical protein [Candidatus Babeliales bacterium]
MVRLYKIISIVLLCGYASLQAVQNVKYDAESVRSFFQNECSQSYSMYNYLLPQLQISADPLKTFLEESKMQINGTYERQSLLEKMTTKNNALFYIVAFYALKTHRGEFLTDKEQFFFKAWEDSLNNKKTTVQTIAHLATENLEKPLEFFEENIYQPQLIDAVNQEQDYCNCGYTVFYHGQQSYFGFYQDFHTEILQECYLQGIFSVSLPQDFLFIRVPKKLRQIMNNRYDKNEGASVRTNIMNNSSDGSYYSDCLSVNGFLFGNTNNYSCSTWDFVVRNSNARYYSGNNMFQDFLEQLEVKTLYTHFKKRVLDLEDEYKCLYKAGRLVQIAVPSAQVDACAFMSFGCACRTSVSISRDSWLGSYYPRSVNDVSVQMSYCLHKNTHAFNDNNYGSEIHYCLVMTNDMVLNPLSGIKVKAYNSQPLSAATVNGVHVTYQEHMHKRKQLSLEIALAIGKAYVMG